MGLPGAGKSTIKRRRMQRGDLDIEPDRFKSRHPRYSDRMGEETDDEVHRWSVRRAADALDNAITSSRKQSLIFDSSGSNARWLGRHISAARLAGYTTQVLWVDVPVEIALLRNRNRACDRDGRWCPERVILDKAEVMAGSFEELSRLAQSSERLQNWDEDQRGGEMGKAELDLWLYPAPRTRPPSLRPGDEGYGEPPPGARSPSPSRGSLRKLRIGPWKRSDSVMKSKNARLAWMDRTYRGDRARYVLDHVLKDRDVLLEPNRYPYMLPPDVEHWTIWCTHTMSTRELTEYIERWLDARRPHNVMSWNFDDNRGRKTIHVWHVHIYFQGARGQRPTFRGLRSARTSSRRSPLSV